MDDDERAFQRRYGAWEPLDPVQAADLLSGFEHPTWVAGGWALEAFTGTSREHEDLDVAFFRRNVAALVDHLEPRYQAFAVGDGMTMRGLTPECSDLPEWADQVWVREHAAGPWLVDMLATEDEGGRWVFRRDPSVSAPVDEVTWVDDVGIRYLRPEIVLAYKAKLDRTRDRRDLAAVLPCLDNDRRTWLRDTVSPSVPRPRLARSA